MSDAIRPLTPNQRRVLGVLIEKQKTSKSPDAYPMTLKSLTTGCNQKSNRDPILELNEDDVEETLLELNKFILVQKVQGGRVERWRHLAYDFWKATQVEMAIVAELLIRGPQSEGDLRGRASRMNDIPDLDQLRELLASLVAKQLVVYLRTGGRGAIVTHGFHTPEELEEERTRYASGTVEAPRSREVATDKYQELRDELELLKARVTALEESQKS
jgi:uncharacterized protein